MDARLIMTTLVAFVTGVFTASLGAYIVHFLAHSRWWKEYRLRKRTGTYSALENHHIAIARV